MKKIYRILAFFLVTITVLGAFSACRTGGNTENPADSQNTNASKETESDKSALEQSGLDIRNLKEANMNIWYSSNSVWSPYPLKVTDEDAVLDIIYKAGYDRNVKLEKDLNINLKYTVSQTNPNGAGDLSDASALRQLWSGGDLSDYDIIFTGAYPCSALAIEGAYFDLSESNYIHPDADYYESQVNKQIRFMNHQFFAMGYYSVMNTAALEATFVNNTIVSNITNGEVTIDTLYDKAINHEWTMSEMLSIGKLYATPDSNTGNYQFDQYSAIVSANGAHSVYHWLGGTTVEWNESSERYNCTLNNTKNVNLMDWIHQNITKDKAFGFVTNDNHANAFLAKASPFLVTSMDVLWNIMDSDIDWGLLPPPCYQTGDDYHSFSTGWNVNFAGIPNSCKDIDKATYLYEMFMCYSYDYIYPVYYKKCFETQYQPSAKSAQVFDLIAHSRFIDLSNLYSLNKSVAIKKIVLEANRGASDMKAAADSITKQLGILIDTFNERKAS